MKAEPTAISPHQPEDRVGESLDGKNISKIDPSAILEMYTLKPFRVFSLNSLDTYSHTQGLEQAIDYTLQ